ncbi:ER lumen protein retaining receptor-domain-containing protein [Chytridium lagenaria]|nr:ER lumen protein retaining receptor-domain-containing protein [Chytridium lagenaria]
MSWIQDAERFSAWTRSAVGISIKTQILYFLLFLARYGNVFWTFSSTSDVALKLVYIGLAFYVVYLMVNPTVRVGDIKKDAFPYEIIIGISFVLAVSSGLWFGSSVSEILESFSMYMESVAIVPQLTFTYQTRQKGNLGPEYLLVLGIYRLARIFSRLLMFFTGVPLDWVAVVFGLVGVGFYVDMVYVYLFETR